MAFHEDLNVFKLRKSLESQTTTACTVDERLNHNFLQSSQTWTVMDPITIVDNIIVVEIVAL